MTVCALVSVTKQYGSQRGIEDVSFDVHEGEIFGFLGANGAGKTTAMRIIMGLLRPTRGTVTLFGEDATQHGPRLRADVGYLPGSLSLYASQTGRQYLEFMAGMRQRDCSRAIAALARRLDLDLDRRINELSKGNRQKVGLVSAFMHEPRLLVLDEATGGLDPLVRREFSVMLHEVKSRGGAILFSSHLLAEVEQSADRVAVLHAGRLVRVDTLAELRSRAIHTLEFDFDVAPDIASFTALTGVSAVRSSNGGISVDVRGDERDLLRLAVACGARSVRTMASALDSVLLDLMEGDHDVDPAA